MFGFDDNIFMDMSGMSKDEIDALTHALNECEALKKRAWGNAKFSEGQEVEICDELNLFEFLKRTAPNQNYYEAQQEYSELSLGDLRVNSAETLTDRGKELLCYTVIDRKSGMLYVLPERFLKEKGGTKRRKLFIVKTEGKGRKKICNS